VSEVLDVRVRFAVDDAALSDLHAPAFGNSWTATQPWAQRLERHSVSWVGTFAGPALVAEVTAAGCPWLHVDYEPHLDGFYRGCGFRPTAAGG
jgi:hypothetical protein